MLHPRAPLHPSALLTFTALLVATACSDQEIHAINDASGTGGPQIQVSPELLEFGEVLAGEVVVRTFTITSVGDSDLEVEDITLGAAASPSFTVLSQDTSFVLPPGASQEVEVAFEAMGADLQTGTAIVTSNDADTQKVTVDLTGLGAVPELKISPDPYDFGTTYVGCAKDIALTLENVGSDRLTVSSIGHSGDPFFLDTSALTLPFDLAPGDSVSVPLDFDPGLEDSYTGTMTVASTEPMGVREATQTGEARFAASYDDVFEIPLDPPSDIIFMVDQSCSMDDNTKNLANNFEYFITNLNSYTTDWRVMVVNDDDGCTSTGVLTTTTSNYVSTFKTQIMLGGGSYTEALLTIASIATAPGKMTGCNGGFRRSDALLHLILVSDEPEQSSKTWSTLVNTIITNIGDSSKVKISAIAGDVPGGCNSAGGSADPGTGYYEAANATSGEFLSICTTSWSSYMSVLAEASVTETTFELSARAVEASLQVYVNGTERTTGWSYDEATNSVVFTEAVPEGGDTVRVTYAGKASCD